jgi:hypothetical protein
MVATTRRPDLATNSLQSRPEVRIDLQGVSELDDGFIELVVLEILLAPLVGLLLSRLGALGAADGRHQRDRGEECRSDGQERKRPQVSRGRHQQLA